MTITLITGANKGLGRETARRLLTLGHTVLVGARDAERGQRTADELGAVLLEIDPTSDGSVAVAAERVRGDYGRLDVLVNNAGTAEPRVGAADLTADDAMRGFDINVFGPIRVMHAFLPLLRASDNPRIVNVSSGGAVRSRWVQAHRLMTVEGVTTTSGPAPPGPRQTGCPQSQRRPDP